MLPRQSFPSELTMPGNNPTLKLFGVTLVVLSLSNSCARKPDLGKTSVSSPMADSIRFQFAIYLLQKQPSDPWVVFRRTAKSRNFTVVDKLPEAPQEMLVRAHMQMNVHKEYPPPDLKMLEYSGNGLSVERKHALQRATAAFILDFAHPKKQVWTALRAANEIVEEIARRTG